MKKLFLMMLLLLTLLSNGCSTSQKSDADTETDTETDTNTATELVTGEGDYPNRIGNLLYAHVCPGCNETAPCEFTPISDSKLAGFNFYPRDKVSDVMAVNRTDHFARELALDTCKLLTPTEQSDWTAELKMPYRIFDAGDVAIESDKTSWSALPVTSNYIEETSNYPNVIVNKQNLMIDYEPEKEISLTASGGTDIAPFTIQTVTPKPLLLISPSVDANGKITSIAVDAALNLKWSGGEAVPVVVVINSYWCTGRPMNTIICRANNDGEFTIPQSIVEQTDFANFARIQLTTLRDVSVSISEIGSQDVNLAIGSTTELTIFHDPQATPIIPTDCGPMTLGQVGNACSDNSSCGNGCCLSDEGYFNGGYCTIPNCETNDDCPSDSVCHPNQNPNLPYNSYCAKRCENNNDCRKTGEYWCHDTLKLCISQLN
jgi:hypothetical protein